MTAAPTLADAINADRARRGETVAAWAARMGVPSKTVSNWLTERPSGPMAQVLIRLLLDPR